MSLANSPEQEELKRLLQRIAQRDQTAFAQLYERTSAKLFGVCMRMLSGRHEAEEVLQETYVAVWERAASFDVLKASAMTWLITLARNKSIDRLRQRRGVNIDRDVAMETIVDDRPTPPSRAESGQEYQRLLECLDELEPQQSQSIREAFFSGITYHELAERVQVPLGTMKSWIRRSLLQLRACLNT